MLQIYVLMYVLVFHKTCSCISECKLTSHDNRHSMDCSQLNLSKIPLLQGKIHNLLLSHNQLESPFSLTSWRNSSGLEQLDLSYNKLTIITEEEVHGLINLKVFNVSHNYLKAVFITDMSVLPNLRSLDLSRNLGLGKSKSLVPFIMKLIDSTVTYLNLSSIGWNTPPNDIFLQDSNLIILDLSTNCMKYVPNLPKNLEYLDFSHNCIDHIDPDCFVVDTQLETLLMESNIFLNDIRFESFNFLTNLEKLSFKGCTKLHHLPSSLFYYNKKLKYLSLEGCNFESISTSFKSSFLSIEVVDLRNNPWNCPLVKWFLQLMKKKSLIFQEEIRCASPTNVSLVEYLDSSPKHRLVWILVVLISVLLVSLMIAAVLFACNMEKKRRLKLNSYLPLGRSKNPTDATIFISSSV